MTPIELLSRGLEHDVENGSRSYISTNACWADIRQKAATWMSTEPALAPILKYTVLEADSLGAALSIRLSSLFAGDGLSAATIRELVSTVLADHGEIEVAVCADLLAICDNDPATGDLLTPFLFLKGFAAISLHRVAHQLWLDGRQPTASALQQRISVTVGVDLHPGAVFGRGILLDHATGIVVGETAVIGDDVILFHSVTLGGTGKGRGDRHPKIGRGAFIGAGAKILGNVKVGEWARVGAGSVVLRDIPPFSVAVGIPARVQAAAFNMDWPDRRAYDAAAAAGFTLDVITRKFPVCFVDQSNRT